MTTLRPSKVNIVSFMLVESGTYNPQYRRGYTTAEIEQSAVDQLRDRLAGRNIQGAGIVTGIADQIVRMSAVPEGEIIIDGNGWDTRRFMFLLTVDIYVRGSTVPMRQIVTGYSEHADVSIYNTIDPDTRFTINNILTLRERTTIDPVTRRKIRTMIPIDCSYLLANKNYRGLSSLREGVDQRIDPYDAMGMMMTTNEMYQDDGAQLFNYTGVNNKTPTKVSRSYSKSSGYLTGILKAFGDAVGSSTDRDGLDTATLCATAQGFVGGNAASTDGFMQAVMSVSNENYLSDFFTLRDLDQLCPDHPMKVIMQGKTQRTSTHSRYGMGHILGDDVHEAGSTEAWSGSDLATQFAAILSQSIPSLMMEMFFTDTYFRATNNTRSNEIEMEWLEVPRPFDDFDVRELSDKFITRAISEIFMGLSMDNVIEFDVEVRCDVTTEVWVDISVDGKPHVKFNTPAFCDNLLTPMITNVGNANGLVKDLYAVMNDVILGDNGNNARNSTPDGYDDSLIITPFSNRSRDRRDSGGSSTPKIII